MASDSVRGQRSVGRFRGAFWALTTALMAAYSASVGAGAPEIPQDVRETVQKRVDHGYCPGIVVGVMNGEGVEYFGYGRTELGGVTVPDETTIFEIGSITKAFTGTLLADMVERQELGLADAAESHLPAGVVVPAHGQQAITLGHLATHISGLPRMPTNFEPADAANPYADYTVERMYAFLDSYSLPRAPGAAWEYSNLGMGLLAHILALRAGTDFETLVTERIGAELGLPDTAITLSPEQAARLARGYSGVVPRPNWDMAALAGAGALRSTAADVLEFLAASRGWRASALSPAMARAQAVHAATGTPGIDMGLGWLLLSLSTGTAVWHDGGTGGYRSFAGFLRDGALLVIVLANSDYDVTDIGLHLLDPAIPLTPPRVPRNVALSTLQGHMGRYAGTDGDSFAIDLLHEHLTFAYSGDAGLAFTLYPSTGRRFYATIVEAEVTFEVNPEGRTTAMLWYQDGETARFERVCSDPTLAIAWADGHVQLSPSGDPGCEYVIEASADLSEWVQVGTAIAGGAPFADPAAAQLQRRFYRVRGSM